MNFSQTNIQKVLKQCSFVLLFLVASTTLFAQNYWMQKGGSATVDEGYSIAIDNAGNTYTTGYFTGTATFGTTTLVSSGSTDIFVAKTDNQGNHVWAVKAGGSGSDRGLSIACDGSGNSYVTGYFYNVAAFGNTNITSAGLQDVFIAKYNNAGALQWVERAGGPETDIGNGIAVDNSGNAVVTGEFKGTAGFGTGSLTSLANSVDAFITKLNSSGAFQWSKKGSSTNADRGIDVACDGSGNIYGIGQFSETITFDNTHNNTIFNATYVIKFNSSGAEQWFWKIGAGTSNFGAAVTTDNSSNVYVTGDFTGNTIFFNSNNTTLGGNYDNRVFVAKYNSGGSLQWAKQSSSDNLLSSKDIAVDNSGNSYIIGNFECVMNDYADEYGQGVFNTVGYKDVFAAKFNSSGTWQWARQVGSRQEDAGNGVAVNSNGHVHYTGSFKDKLFVPTSGNFSSSNLNKWTDYSCTNNDGYCNDPDYHKFHGMSATGNSDVVMAKCFDPDREPYDYYLRNGTGCARPIGEVCIEDNCPDTVESCSQVFISAKHKTCPNVGPDFDYKWSNFSSQSGITVYSSGTYTVTITSKDGCIARVDDIVVIIHPLPAKPTISDDVIINTNSQNPQKIELCQPDSVTLTGGNYGSNSHLWFGPGLPNNGFGGLSFNTSLDGFYSFTVTDSNGCTRTTVIELLFHPPLDSFDLEMLVDDSVTVCDGDNFEVQLYDSVSNPSANNICLPINTPWKTTTFWTVTPPIPYGENCETFAQFFPDTTGWYTISAMVIRETACDTDTFYVTKDVHATVNPTPTVPPFVITMTGSNYYCPADSTLLTISGGPNYLWSGPGINGNTNDSVYVSQDATYCVTSTVSDTNSFGCFDSYSASACINVSEKPQPNVTSSTTVICPGDSVLLTSIGGNFGAYYHWEGPSGPLTDTTQSVWVDEAGSYYVIVYDSDSCNLVSNTIVIDQYATPLLLTNGNPVLCDGDSLVISVVSNVGSTINWLPPLSGNGLSQTIYSPGTYQCEITSCGITTLATIVVDSSYVDATIIPDGPLCEGDSITLQGSSGMDTYSWNPSGETTESIIIDGPGTYTLTTTDTNGCVAVSDPIVISVVQVQADISVTGSLVFCFGDSITLYGNSNVAGWEWNPGNYNGQNYTIYEAGTYTLTTTDTNGCTGKSVPITVYMPDTIAQVFNIGEVHFCEGDSVDLYAEGGLDNYLWEPGGFTSDTITVYGSGTYTLTTVDTFGCSAKSEPIEVIEEPNLLTPPVTDDDLICAGTQANLYASTGLGEVNWYEDLSQAPIFTGNDFTTPVLTKNTTYYVLSEESVCKSGETPVFVEVEDCDAIFVPNVFTPNGDGTNDFFQIDLRGATCFNLKIYNRWGIMIHEMTSEHDTWDGIVNQSGEPAVDGVYYYIAEYCKYDNSMVSVTGYFSLLRGGK